MQNQDDDTILIVVMGATGSGKTTFINMASGQNLRVGNSLQSCTSQVQPSEPFEIAGRRIRLIDTPGFDDTNVPDGDTLNLISVYLSTTYRKGKKPSGIVYMHDVTAKRFTGTSRRNLYMLMKFCGEDSVKNVTLVTNMWEGIESEEKGVARERELRNHFQSLLELGAGMRRNYNTHSSAIQILFPIVRNVPEALRIQKQIVDDNIPLEHTDAGSAIIRQLLDYERQHQSKLKALRAELEEMTKLKKEMKVALEEMRQEAQEFERKIAQAKAEREGLSSGFQLLEENVLAGILKAMKTASGDRPVDASSWGMRITKDVDAGDDSVPDKMTNAYDSGRAAGAKLVGFGVGTVASGANVLKSAYRSVYELIFS